MKAHAGTRSHTLCGTTMERDGERRRSGLAMTNTEKLLTVQELARRLDVGRQKVRELARSGSIPFLCVGGAMRFQWGAVVQALANPNHGSHLQANERQAVRP